MMPASDSSRKAGSRQQALRYRQTVALDAQAEHGDSGRGQRNRLHVILLAASYRHRRKPESPTADGYH